MAAGGGTRAIVAAFFANLGIAIAKFVAFLLTRASSMLAESIHSVADASNQGLLLLGGRRAQRAASEEHPFGYGRVRYFYAFVVAVVLFLLGGVFAMYEGIEKLRHPHEVSSVTAAVTVLVIGIALESWSFRTAILESNEIREGRSWWAFVRQSRVPELPVVLLEDLGALVGLVLALAGVGLTAATGDPTWDALGTVSIGVLLTVIAVILIVETKSLLIGESASREDLDRIRTVLRNGPHVRRLLHLQTQHLGPEELLVAAKVEMDEHLSFDEVVTAIDATESQLREQVPIARVIYVEPDVPRLAGRPAR